jgi:hypothetical protein
MNDSNVLLLQKVIYLGQRFEKNKIFDLLMPWTFDGNDSIQVQNAGKKISNFIGLPNLTFVISYTKQSKSTAGHIELNNNNDEGVFIEIDEKFKSEPEIILAILAHEICHKLIYINNLTQFGYENEILTDVATIYTGLGKLSLNGCEKVNTTTLNQINEKKETIGTKTTTTTQKVGYLNKSQFAFLYKIICNMRRIPKGYAMTGLNSSATTALNKVFLNHDDDLFYNEYAHKVVTETLQDTVHNYQLVSALNTKLLKTFQDNLELVNEKDKAVHKKIKSINEKYISKANENLHSESLNYLKNFILLNEVYEKNGFLLDEENVISKINSHFQDFLFNHNGEFEINLRNRENLYNIKCSACGHKMGLKQDKLVRIKCLKCNYSFIVDNTIIEQINESEEIIQSKKSFKQKLKEIMEILKE